MKLRNYISALVVALAFCGCVDKEMAVEFGLDSSLIEIGAEGGTQKIKIASDDNWIATTNEPWITVSPANGRGSVTCQIQIDSALAATTRRGTVRIQNQNSWENREITIDQKGFDYAIVLPQEEMGVENFAGFGSRYFDIKVNTNVDFDIEVPATAQSWVKYEKKTPVFDRGIRPREVTVRFNWGINSQPNERIAQIKFKPKDGITLTRQDELKIVQSAAEEIPRDTRKGDSIALLAVSRSLGVWYAWTNDQRMENWTDVQLWEEGHPGYTPAKKGRVRYARFYIFSTKDGIPFEVQYLTAADELVFYGNGNSFQLSLDPGEYITQLKQLRRLTISGYGLTTLPASFTELKNLESLELGGNNFQAIPAILNSTNFPKLHRLIMRANQRNSIYDLSNTVTKDYGGFADEGGFPRRMLEWDNLDTLVLSVNYLSGSLPTMSDHTKYTQEDINAADSLPQALIGIPKVLPKMMQLHINLNRFTGDLPDWLLYHPGLNFWHPDIMVFNQEGKDLAGKLAGFDNTPLTLDYYFNFFPKKKRPNTDVFPED